MDRKLASEIHEHLLDASDALRSAERAGQKLKGYDERKAFHELIASVITPLDFELMPSLYAEHPELKPPHGPSFVSSVLRWEDVSLPTSITEAEIDAAIFAALRPRSMKVAKIIGDVLTGFEASKLPISDEIIGAPYWRWRKPAGSKARAICRGGCTAR